MLLQKQDEKLLLKCHSKTAVGSLDSKQTFSPVLKLNAVLVRSVATGTREQTVPARQVQAPALLLRSSERWVTGLLACPRDFPSTPNHVSGKMWFSQGRDGDSGGQPGAGRMGCEHLGWTEDEEAELGRDQ